MKSIKYSILLLALIMLISCQPSLYRTERISNPSIEVENEIQSKYQNVDLSEVIDYKLFRMAMVGFYNMDVKKKNIISIIDYSKASTEKRLYVIDLENEKLLFNTHIAHGVNSGENYATVFSNVPESRISSLGFFITAETYEGSNGYSMRIDGIEKGINHNARKRDIVIHQADYVSVDFIKEEGRLGRSWGCPALPNDQSAAIIDAIKEGSCIFVYGEDDNYFKKSKLVSEE